MAEDYETFLNSVDELRLAELKPGNLAEQIGRTF